MTKKDFFRVIIKLFALYSSTLSIFTVFPTYIGYSINAFDPITIILAIALLIIIIGLLIALIFSADKIISLLKLDKGFDEEYIDFGNLKEMSILKLAIIVISGLLIIDNFPIFLNNCYLAFKDQVSGENIGGVFDTFVYKQVDYFEFFISAVSILIGYLMITNYTNIANWLSRADKKHISD